MVFVDFILAIRPYIRVISCSKYNKRLIQNTRYGSSNAKCVNKKTFIWPYMQEVGIREAV